MDVTATPSSARRLVVPLATVVAVLVAVSAIALPSGRVGAQSSSTLVLRAVDTVEPASSSLQFLWTVSPADAADATLTENGSAIETDAARPLPTSTPMSIALVFDTSEAMDSSGALIEAKEAAKEWIEGREGAQVGAQAFAVYVAADTGVQLQGYTTDTERLVETIDRIAPPATEEARGEAAVWSAIAQAAQSLEDRPGSQPSIVVMTGTNDSVTGSTTRAVARGAVRSSGAAVFAAELLGAGLDPGSLDALVRSSGGLVFSTDQGGEFGTAVADIGEAVSAQQYELGFASPTELGSVADMTLQVGDQTATASVVVGSAVRGTDALNPTIIPASGGVGFLQGNLGLILLVVVALLAVGLLAYGVFMLFVREDRLAAVLSPYESTAAVATPVDDDGGDSALARTAIMQRAVAITEQVATDRGVLVRAENALERANLPLRAGEALLFYVLLVVIATVLALVVSGSLLLGLIVGVVAALVPVGTVNFLAARRRKQFMALLPDTLTLLASTLRAGYSLMQGVEAVAEEVSEPMGLELRRVVTEARLGRPLEEALDGTAERMASPDFAWAVMAIRIQREVGGNLSELLMTVADTMIERERLRRDVQSLTAEGRVSAIVLGLLPVGLAAVMFVINPDYSRQLIDTTLGNVMLVAAVLSMLAGFLWMKKIIDIEI
jgi:tight adherence protein B